VAVLMITSLFEEVKLPVDDDKVNLEVNVLMLTNLPVLPISTEIVYGTIPEILFPTK
jgi:hypothetical protein